MHQVAELDLAVDGWSAGRRVIVRSERLHAGVQLRLWDHDGISCRTACQDVANSDRYDCCRFYGARSSFARETMVTSMVGVHGEYESRPDGVTPPSIRDVPEQALYSRVHGLEPGRSAAVEDLIDESEAALDLGASIGLFDDSKVAEGESDSERVEIAHKVLDRFADLGSLTGWSRTPLARLVGCHHPDPSAWLSADPAELLHSLHVMTFISDIASRVAEADVSARGEAISVLAGIDLDSAQVIARREAARVSIQVCKDLLRRARGSVAAVRRVFDDETLVNLIAQDDPGEAIHRGRDALRPLRERLAYVESQLGSISLLSHK